MDIYQAVGLNANEAQVYETLITLGKGTVTEISNHNGLERTMLYGILSRLIEKGIVTQSSEGKIKHFSPAPPETLLNLLKNKEEIVKNRLPELNEIYLKTHSKQEARIYAGKQAVKNLLEELLNENQTWYVIGGTSDIKQALDVYLPQFHRRRKERKIVFNVIFTKDSIKRAGELRKEKYAKVKFLPQDFAAPMHVAITGNKVAFNLWDQRPLGILIESEHVAKSFRKYFAFLWKQAKK